MLGTDAKEFKRERPEGVVLQDGTCRFCGQMRQIEAITHWDRDDINEAVTETCDCHEAKYYAASKKKKERAYRTIRRKFQSGGDSWPDPLVEILFLGVDSIVGEKMKALTLDDGDGTKARLGLTSKGGIKVEKTITKKESEEV